MVISDFIVFDTLALLSEYSVGTGTGAVVKKPAVLK